MGLVFFFIMFEVIVKFSIYFGKYDFFFRMRVKKFLKLCLSCIFLKYNIINGIFGCLLILKYNFVNSCYYILLLIKMIFKI